MPADQYPETIARLRARLYLSRVAALLVTCFFAGATSAQPQCPPAEGVALQVLGSGGPIADDSRASSGYVLWHDGYARALIDTGGGVALRFAESGADFADLDAILLSHLHADHSADLPALLKSGVFSSRERSLVLAGPPAGGNARVSFPSLEDYVASLLQPESGAYGYLGGYLDGSDGLPYLRLAMIEDLFEDEDDEEGENDDEEEGGDPGDDIPADAAWDELDVTTISLRDSALRISALPVGHGPVPAVAYRIEVAGHTIVFAGDQDGRSDDLAFFARGADLLVLHMPIPEGAGTAALALHAAPSRLGEIASSSGTQRVLLSHFMQRSLRNLAENVAAMREEYAGEILIADDLACFSTP